jgi:ABC-2 type transport system permease protein
VGRTYFLRDILCMGDRKKGHANLLFQVQCHSFRHSFPSFYVPILYYWEERSSSHPYSRTDLYYPPFLVLTNRTVSITLERRVKTFERLLSAPISLDSVILGESLSGFLYSLGIACLTFAVGIFIFGTPIVHASVLVISIILTAFCFAMLGTLFAAYPTETAGEVMAMLNTVRLPLIFISGVFVPISDMPRIGQRIAFISPLTYGNDLIGYAYTGKSLFSPLLDIVMLVIFILFFHIIASYLYKNFTE